MYSRLVQLHTHIPVVVTSKENRRGRCIGWIDYGEDHDLIWIVAFDDTGEVWHVPNPEVRLEKNWTMEKRRQTNGEV